MPKILTGSTISYGATLPPAGTTSDGSLFFLTTAYTDAYANSWTPGLHLFSFQQDINTAVAGSQVGQGWKQLSSLADFVEVTGDTMTGPLVIQGISTTASFASNLTRLNLQNTSSSGGWSGLVFSKTAGTPVAAILEVAAGAGIGALAISTANGSGLVERARFPSTGGMTIDGNTVWHAGNDGASSGLDADLLDGQHGTYYLDLANATGNLNLSTNTTGTLPVSRGGTNATTTVQGGVVYGVSTTQYGTTAAGSSGQILQSNGTSAPTWINASSLTAGSAASLNPGRTIAISGAVTGAGVLFDGTTNITITTTATANSTPWSALSGLNNFVSSRTDFASTPAANFTTYARPSYFFDLGSSGALSMTPPQFPSASITGFDSYNTSDIGQYYVGMTVMGVGGSGARAMQLAANWDFDEGIPNTTTSLRFRVNDDTGTVASWGAWANIWHSGNFTPGNYVLRTGDTGLTGNFATNANFAGSTLTAGSVSIPSAGGINAAGNIQAGLGGSGFITAQGNVNANGGRLTSTQGVTVSSGSQGQVTLQIGGASNSGYIEFISHTSAVRQGYIGFSSTNATIDTGTIPYVAGTHAFTGNITATQNITAYSSDGRLKKNVKPIVNAVDKVKQLGGYSYDWDLEKCEEVGFKPERQHEHGLIAQEVELVIPDAVAPAPFNNEYKTVRYDRLVGLLMAAVTEQAKQIETLTKAIEELKAK